MANDNAYKLLTLIEFPKDAKKSNLLYIDKEA